MVSGGFLVPRNNQLYNAISKRNWDVLAKLFQGREECPWRRFDAGGRDCFMDGVLRVVGCFLMVVACFHGFKLFTKAPKTPGSRVLACFFYDNSLGNSSEQDLMRPCELFKFAMCQIHVSNHRSTTSGDEHNEYLKLPCSNPYIHSPNMEHNNFLLFVSRGQQSLLWNTTP